MNRYEILARFVVYPVLLLALGIHLLGATGYLSVVVDDVGAGVAGVEVNCELVYVPSWLVFGADDGSVLVGENNREDIRTLQQELTPSRTVRALYRGSRSIEDGKTVGVFAFTDQPSTFRLPIGFVPEGTRPGDTVRVRTTL